MFTTEELKLIREVLGKIRRNHGLKANPIVALYQKGNRLILEREKG